MGLPGGPKHRTPCKGANFRYNDASVAQIDYTLPRGLDRNQMERLASLDFVRKGDNLFITGCAGTGKLPGHSSGIRGLQGRHACHVRKRLQTDGHSENRQNKGTIEAELKKLEKRNS